MKGHVYNPNDVPVEELPWIYGFNNGGRPNFYVGIMLAEDGTYLGSHLCSDENFMLKDLGILESGREKRKESFREHYPNGYRTEFISYGALEGHAGLNKAIKLHENSEEKQNENQSTE